MKNGIHCPLTGYLLIRLFAIIPEFYLHDFQKRTTGDFAPAVQLPAVNEIQD